MGCGSSTATSTAGQPAPKLKRIKEEEENEESSRKQIRKVVTPPSSANGHVPHEITANSSESGSTSNEQTSIIEDAEIGTHDNVEPLTAEENAGSRASLDNNTAVTTEKATEPENSASSVQENHLSRDESLIEGAPASDLNTSHSKVTVDEQQPVVVISSTPVGEEGVPGALADDDQKPEAIEEKPGEAEGDVATVETDVTQNKATSEVSLSGEKETVPTLDQTNTNSVTALDSDGVAAGIDVTQHRVVSEVSLSDENNTAPVVVDQTKRDSVTASEHSAAPADNEVDLSRHHRGSSELESVSPTVTEGAQSSQEREPSKEDSVSLGRKESLNDQKFEHDSVSSPAEAAESSQSREISNEDSVGQTAEASDDFPVKSESTLGRICTLSASVLIGSLDDPQGERTVTLTGSVYRVPSATTPKPGEKIGIIKGDVTSTPVDNESSEKVATLRGDLLAVSGEATSRGQIATASIDVLSCATGEKIATITADVAPNDDPESASGVISGEVLGASESGSYDEKIGSLAGKVVALTFDDDVISVSSADEEVLKLRRESCFI